MIAMISYLLQNALSHLIDATLTRLVLWDIEQGSDV